MTTNITSKLISQTSKIDEQIASRQDKPIASTINTRYRNCIVYCIRGERITYFAAEATAALAVSVLSPMLRLPKKVSRSSGSGK